MQVLLSRLSVPSRSAGSLDPAPKVNLAVHLAWHGGIATWYSYLPR